MDTKNNKHRLLADYQAVRRFIEWLESQDLMICRGAMPQKPLGVMSNFIRYERDVANGKISEENLKK